MRNASKLKMSAWGMVLFVAAIGAGSVRALAEDVVSLDNGDRLIVLYHWEIEHRARNPIDIFVHQLGTPEGRKMLGLVATAAGFNPAAAAIVAANVPLPHLNLQVTDNKGILPQPTMANGMTICKAGQVGDVMEASNATWTGTIVRNNNQDGVAYYTSVGTSPATTHRIKGNFYVEYVKPLAGWEQKFACMPDGKLAWQQPG